MTPTREKQLSVALPFLFGMTGEAITSWFPVNKTEQLPPCSLLNIVTSDTCVYKVHWVTFKLYAKTKMPNLHQLQLRLMDASCLAGLLCFRRWSGHHSWRDWGSLSECRTRGGSVIALICGWVGELVLRVSCWFMYRSHSCLICLEMPLGAYNEVGENLHLQTFRAKCLTP